MVRNHSHFGPFHLAHMTLTEIGCLLRALVRASAVAAAEGCTTIRLRRKNILPR